jgi:hypothetical protein
MYPITMTRTASPELNGLVAMRRQKPRRGTQQPQNAGKNKWRDAGAGECTGGARHLGKNYS